MRNPHAVPLDIFKKSVETICAHTADGTINGFIIPQAGWFSAPSKYEHVNFLRNYLQWFAGTATTR
jgi:putative AlgH/UPF0301 family transcriptional regulator